MASGYERDPLLPEPGWRELVLFGVLVLLSAAAAILLIWALIAWIT
jgi:hypothetical protein